MNTIRTIESATLISVGIFCASAMINIALHSNSLLPNEAPLESANVIHLPTVTVIGHRLSANEKAQAPQEQGALTDTLAVEHSGKAGVMHAG
jgi:hypothetical protein